MLKFWLTFSNHSSNKQMLLFFGPPESQLAKCLEHPQNTVAMPFALGQSAFALAGALLPLGSHCLDCASSSEELLGSIRSHAGYREWMKVPSPPLPTQWLSSLKVGETLPINYSPSQTARFSLWIMRDLPPASLCVKQQIRRNLTWPKQGNFHPSQEENVGAAGRGTKLVTVGSGWAAGQGSSQGSPHSRVGGRWVSTETPAGSSSSRFRGCHNSLISQLAFPRPSLGLLKVSQVTWLKVTPPAIWNTFYEGTSKSSWKNGIKRSK